MKRKISLIKSIDWITVLIFLLLVFFGWLNIYAAVFNEQHHHIFDLSQRYGKQLIWIIGAIFLAIIVFLIDEKFYFVFSYLIYGLSIISLIFVLLIGEELHGSRSWFEIGGFNFQPSEFAKVATSLALAKYMSSYNFRINKFKPIFTIFLLVIMPVFLIALQPDLGSAIVFFSFLLVVYRAGFSEFLLLVAIIFAGLFISTLVIDKLYILLGLIGITAFALWFAERKFKYVAGALVILVMIVGVIYGLNVFLNMNMNYYYILAAGLLVSLPVYLIYAVRKRLRKMLIIIGCLLISVLFSFSIDYVYHDVLREHQQKRLNVLLGLETDPLGDGYNINQSKIAIGSGGVTGKGFLNGTQTKFDFVPEQSTDFIFCTVGEEWGFIGTSVVIGLFIILFLRLIFIAERQRSDFSRIYGYGVIAILFTHFAINIGMTIGLLPVIGIPLPFFSYGGSALWAFTILLFIMLRLDAVRMELLR
jgi:rod shape determining protein RodA